MFILKISFNVVKCEDYLRIQIETSVSFLLPNDNVHINNNIIFINTAVAPRILQYCIYLYHFIYNIYHWTKRESIQMSHHKFLCDHFHLG